MELPLGLCIFSHFVLFQWLSTLSCLIFLVECSISSTRMILGLQEIDVRQLQGLHNFYENAQRRLFVNFIDHCKRMHRQQEHVMTFLLAEMGTSGSLDGQQRLVVKVRFAPKTFEGILQRYISKYIYFSFVIYLLLTLIYL